MAAEAAEDIPKILLLPLLEVQAVVEEEFQLLQRHQFKIIIMVEQVMDLLEEQEQLAIGLEAEEVAQEAQEVIVLRQMEALEE